MSDMNINEICEAAQQLEIKLTNAELGTDLCEAWEDRVVLAAKLFAEGEFDACQTMIDEANRYAI